MKKIEVSGDIYYYDNGIYLDENFVQVDERTKEQIKTKLNETGTISEFLQHYSKSVSKKPVIKFNSNISSSKRDYDLTTKEVSLRDYGLSEKDIEEYNNSLQMYDKEKKDVQETNQSNDKKADKVVRNTLIMFVSIIIIMALINSSDPSVGMAIFSLILSFLIPAIYYKYKMSSLEKIPEPDRYKYVSKELENKINRYRNDKIRYDEEMRRATVAFWGNLSAFQFEKEVAALFKSIGASSAYVTPKVNDGGMDVIMKYKNKNYAIECKHHQSPVGPAMIDRLRGVLSKEIPNGIFVSLNGYTFEAKKRNNESRTPILLLDKHNLTQIAKSKDFNIYLK